MTVINPDKLVALGAHFSPFLHRRNPKEHALHCAGMSKFSEAA